MFLNNLALEMLKKEAGKLLSHPTLLPTGFRPLSLIYGKWWEGMK